MATEAIEGMEDTGEDTEDTDTDMANDLLNQSL